MLRFFGSLDPCLVGMEACATAQFWAREIGALGHEVRMMPPAYVKAYVRRQKNDAADDRDAPTAAPGFPAGSGRSHCLTTTAVGAACSV